LIIKTFQQKTGHFHEKKNLTFSNFGPLGDSQDIKIFEKLFNTV